jgi:hypothetical protein
MPACASGIADSGTAVKPSVLRCGSGKGSVGVGEETLGGLYPGETGRLIQLAAHLSPP